MLRFFLSPPFYTDHIKLPHGDDPTPPEISGNAKFDSFFDGAIGAIDGTHINCYSSAKDRHSNRDRKGGITQNCLAACSFDMRFLYIFSGWEGSAADAAMFHDARITDLRVPAGKFYLADTGFPNCSLLLIPYPGVRYHLQEWGHANLR